MLGADALRFDRDEIAATFADAGASEPDGGEVDAIEAVTAGWPAAVVLAAAGVDRSLARDAAPGATAEATLRSLLDGLLDAADPTVRKLVADVAHLPLLSAAVLDAVGGPGSLARLVDAGLPIHVRADGWAELPGPVRDRFPELPLPREQAREVAHIYARRGELAEATALLHRVADPEGVVALLAEQRREALVAAGLVVIEAALADIPDDVLGAQPGLLVRLVQAAERQARLRAAWLARAMQVLPAGSAPRRAVAAEVGHGHGALRIA